MHLSIDDESKALLVQNEQESQELVNCDKPAMDGTNKDVLDSACCSSHNGGEACTPEKAVKEERVSNHYDEEPIQVPQNGCHGNVQREEVEDFIAKDLLSFAWQIARGMVSTVE